MASNALEKFIERTRKAWGPLTSELVADCQQGLEDLLTASPAEEWLAALHRKKSASEELYRDPFHGFVLLAHTEQKGLYRPPHDHGRGWVIYAMQSGESDMRTYAQAASREGQVRLVRRNSTMVRPGQVQVYLPGDIHDTRCMSETALVYRFTSIDLKKEDKVEHRVARYVERDGIWTTAEQ